MGCSNSKSSQEDEDADIRALATSTDFGASLQRKLNFQLLMLGVGESGKSTFVKQLGLIYGREMADAARDHIQNDIRLNLLECVIALSDASTLFGLWDRSDTRASGIVQQVAGILALPHDELDFPEEIGDSLVYFWELPSVQAAYEKRKDFYLPDSADYYFTHCGRICDPEFEATEEDYIMTRVRTIGMHTTRIQDNSSPIIYNVVDVGGQKSERRKWGQNMEANGKVKAVLYMANLAEYDTVMFEDTSLNRLDDCLVQFRKISHAKQFADVPFYLILNKKDLFEKKVQTKVETKGGAGGAQTKVETNGAGVAGWNGLSSGRRASPHVLPGVGQGEAGAAGLASVQEEDKGRPSEPLSGLQRFGGGAGQHAKRTSSFTERFPDFTGGGNSRAALKYLQDLFEAQLPEHRKGSATKVHIIAARFKRDVRDCFEQIKKEILSQPETVEILASVGQAQGRALRRTQSTGGRSSGYGSGGAPSAAASNNSPGLQDNPLSKPRASTSPAVNSQC